MENRPAPISWVQRVQWQKATGLVAMAAAPLIALASFLLIRKILTTPSWPDNTDLSVYLNAADAILAGRSPYNPTLYPADPYGYPPALR